MALAVILLGWRIGIVDQVIPTLPFLQERTAWDAGVAQSTVAKYMVERRGPPSQSWSTFLLRNHAPEIAAVDLFVVPTVSFRPLYALVIVRLDARRLVRINATMRPTAERIARQITEAFPWDEAPVYLIRDRDRA